MSSYHEGGQQLKATGAPTQRSSRATHTLTTTSLASLDSLNSLAATSVEVSRSTHTTLTTTSLASLDSLNSLAATAVEVGYSASMTTPPADALPPLADCLIQWLWDMVVLSPSAGVSWELRQGLADTLLLPLVHKAPHPLKACLGIFRRNICHSMVEAMYRGLSDSDIKQWVFSPIGPLMKNSTLMNLITADFRALTACCRNNSNPMNLITADFRSLTVCCRNLGNSAMDLQMEGLARRAMCRAWNACMALVAATQNNVKQYVKPLHVAGGEGERITMWRHLFGSAKEVPTFTVETSSGGRGSYTAKLQKAKANSSAGGPALLMSLGSTLHSSNPSVATLSAKISSSQLLDEFNPVNLIHDQPPSQQRQEQEDALLDGLPRDLGLLLREREAGDKGRGWLVSMDDEMDAHACMVPLVMLMERATGLTSEPPASKVMPEWAAEVLKALEADDSVVPRYAKLFLCKAILHTELRRDQAQAREQHASGSASGALTHATVPSSSAAMVKAIVPAAVTDRQQKYGDFHYVLRDLCLVALQSWGKIFERRGETAGAAALDAPMLRYDEGGRLSQAAGAFMPHLVLPACKHVHLLCRIALYDIMNNISTIMLQVLDNNIETVKMLLGRWGRCVALPVDVIKAHIASGSAKQQRNTDLGGGTDWNGEIKVGGKAPTRASAGGQADGLVGGSDGPRAQANAVLRGDGAQQLWSTLRRLPVSSKPSTSVCRQLWSTLQRLPVSSKPSTSVGALFGLILTRLKERGPTARLSFTPDGGHTSDLTYERVADDVRDCIRALQGKGLYPHSISLLEQASSFHPPVVDSSVSFLLSALARVAGGTGPVYRAEALEVLRRRAGGTAELSTVLLRELSHTDMWAATVADPKPVVQQKAIQLLRPLLLAERDELALAPAAALIDIMTLHPDSACRYELIQFLREAWDARPSWRDAVLRAPLVVMLGDADPTVRKEALEMWHASLSRSPTMRLDQMLQLAALPELQDKPASWREQLHGRWGAAASLLLLRLVQDHPDCQGRALCPAPLGECDFLDVHVRTAPAATAHFGSMGTSAEVGTESDASFSSGAALFRGGGYIQATQANSSGYRPTVSLSLNDLAPDVKQSIGQVLPAQGGSPHPSGRGGSPLLGSPGAAKALGLAGVANLSHRMGGTSHQRTGFILPMMAMADRDVQSARLTLSELMAMFAQGAGAEQRGAGPSFIQKDQLASLQRSLAAAFALQSTQPSFLSCLQSLAVSAVRCQAGSSGQAVIEPAHVLAAGNASGGLQAAALQIEESIIIKQKPAEVRGGRSISQGSWAAAPADADAGTWRALAVLYQELGDADLASLALDGRWNMLSLCDLLLPAYVSPNVVPVAPLLVIGTRWALEYAFPALDGRWNMLSRCDLLLPAYVSPGVIPLTPLIVVGTSWALKYVYPSVIPLTRLNVIGTRWALEYASSG
eukprot:gene11148-18768_t